ncbi:MAG TPA: ligase-associated DNA damage response endonuclease PdeM [Rhizomicrobium sp.]|nr:ligase-associated DNA damage response endonuclease PdeM [Rhizomicrobium sp.]
MSDVLVEVNGEALLLDPAGALWWQTERTLVFADLHFEKGSAYARSGQMLPPYDTRTTLLRMEGLISRHAPARVIALGDSFHDSDAANRLDAHERETLIRLRRAAEWIWIAGNHDPAPPPWLGGKIADEVAIGGLVFRHEPSLSPPPGEIAGHLHPCKSITRRGRSLRRRCFVSDRTRLVMPAFGAYAGGLDVRDLAVRSLFGEMFLAYLLGTRRVYAVAA